MPASKNDGVAGANRSLFHRAWMHSATDASGTWRPVVSSTHARTNDFRFVRLMAVVVARAPPRANVHRLLPTLTLHQQWRPLSAHQTMCLSLGGHGTQLETTALTTNCLSQQCITHTTYWTILCRMKRFVRMNWDTGVITENSLTKLVVLQTLTLFSVWFI